MNQPRLSYALLTALCLAATAQAESLLPHAAAAETGCTGALGAGGVMNGEARVIFHDGSHAPVSVPVTPRDDSASAASSVAASTTSSGSVSGGGGAAMVLPSAEPSKPRTGPRWQTFLPGSLK